MAITLTIDSTDRTSLLRAETLRIPQAANEFVATCSFVLTDQSGSVTITEKDDVSVTDNGTTLFAGLVARVQLQPLNDSVRRIIVQCQDYNILVEEAVIDSEESYSSQSDSAIIADLFSKYRSDIDATTYVSTLKTLTMSFENMTLRQALKEICKRSGGRWYVDEQKRLHYFSSESNTASWYLSDNPDNANSFGYQKIEKRSDAATLVNRVFVVGKGVSGWREDTTSIATYGTRPAVVVDRRITTTQGVQDRGDAILAKWANPRVTYKVTTMKSGLRAGMDVRLVCALFGVDATFTVRRLTMHWKGNQRFYDLELGEAEDIALTGGQTWQDRLNQVEDGVTNLDDTVFDTDAPAAPTFADANLTTGVEEDADGHQMAWIKATWGSVSDDDLDHYEIQCADNTSFNWPIIFRVKAGDTREVIFRGLKGNTDYYLRVRAVDWVGNYSAWSPATPGYLTKTTAKDTAAPAAPTNVSAAGAATAIGIQWDANSEADLAYYELQRAPDSGGSPGTYATIAICYLNFFWDKDFTDAQIAAQDAFWYRVRAVDTSGNASNYVATTSSTQVGQVVNDHIAAGTITGDRIAANTITAAEIAANTITATELNVSQLSAITADMGLLTAGEIRVGTGTVGTDFTGFRIMSSYIGGYNSDTLQAGIRSSDGKFVAAGGDVVLDANGIQITRGTSGTDYIRAIRWMESGNERGRINCYYSDPNYYVHLHAGSTASATPAIYLVDSGADDYIRILAGRNADSYIQMGVYDSSFPNETYVTIKSGPKAFINAIGTTAGNAKMTTGLTINQGANDDEILALKSSDVAHGATTLAETDTFFSIQKSDAAAGGVLMRGLRDADADNHGAFGIAGYLAEDVDTTKTTAGRAIIELYAYQTSGANIVDTVANGNLLALLTYRGGTYVTVMVVDEDGDLYYDGSASSYDNEDDALMAHDLSQALTGQWNRMIAYNEQELEALGVLSIGEDGVPFVSNKRINMLLLGAIGQLHQRYQQHEQALLSLGVNPKLLEA